MSSAHGQFRSTIGSAYAWRRLVGRNDRRWFEFCGMETDFFRNERKFRSLCAWGEMRVGKSNISFPESRVGEIICVFFCPDYADLRRKLLVMVIMACYVRWKFYFATLTQRMMS